MGDFDSLGGRGGTHFGQGWWLCAAARLSVGQLPSWWSEGPAPSSPRRCPAAWPSRNKDCESISQKNKKVAHKHQMWGKKTQNSTKFSGLNGCVKGFQRFPPSQGCELLTHRGGRGRGVRRGAAKPGRGSWWPESHPHRPQSNSATERGRDQYSHSVVWERKC